MFKYLSQFITKKPAEVDVPQQVILYGTYLNIRTETFRRVLGNFKVPNFKVPNLKFQDINPKY